MKTIKKNRVYFTILGILTIVAIAFGAYKIAYPNKPSISNAPIKSSQSSQSSETGPTIDSLASWETDASYVPPSISTVESTSTSTIETPETTEESVVYSSPREEEKAIIENMSLDEAASIALSLTNGSKIMLDEEDEYVYIFGVFSDEETHVSRLGTVYVNKNYSSAEFVEN